MTSPPAVRPQRLAVLLALVVAAAALLAAAAPAGAAFPGRDGKLVHTWFSFYETEFAPFTSRTETALRVVGPRRGDPVTLRGCVRETGEPDAGDCSIGYASPSVSPNGRWIAFDAGARLALMRIDGRGLRLLPRHSDDDRTPAFSPDGRRLAFVRGPIAPAGRSLPRGIWTTGLAGGRIRHVTGRGTAPNWSTRNWIAFLRRDGVYRVRPDGDGLRRLVHRTRCTDVAWAPRGTKLAFACGTRHSGGRLYVADGDGRHMRRVVVRYASPETVAWSPSGRRLAVISSFGSLVTIRPDGSGERERVGAGNGATYSFGPASVDWQPLR